MALASSAVPGIVLICVCAPDMPALLLTLYRHSIEKAAFLQAIASQGKHSVFLTRSGSVFSSFGA